MEISMTKNEKDYLKFMNPSNIYTNFMLASLFTTSYGLLKNSIISQIESFYTNGFNQNGYILGEKYKTDVLNLDKNNNKLNGSLLWLINHGVISQDDKEKFDIIRKERNMIAHNTLKILTDSEKDINTDLLIKIKELLKKIDQWFILEVELPTDPDMTIEQYEAIDTENIQSMSMIYLDYLIGIVFGDTEEYNKLYQKFKEFIVGKYGKNKI